MMYMGGKSRLKNQICSILNNSIQYINTDNYYEPFMGGFNILEGINCKNKYASDINKYLIAFIDYIKNGGLIPETLDKETWYDIKYNKDKYPDYLVFIAGSICSFNGRWFEGYAAAFKTKDGSIRDKLQNARQSINYQINKIKDCHISLNSYLDVNIKPHSVIYCDPPYINTDTYNNETFNHAKFYDWCIEKSKNNLIYIRVYNAGKVV